MTRFLQKLCSPLTKHSLTISLVGMVLLVVWVTFLTPGSREQRILFLIGSLCMRIAALLNKDPMFITLEYVIILGTILWFFARLPNLVMTLIMVIATIAAWWSIISLNLFAKRPQAMLWAIGLALLALWFATDAWLFWQFHGLLWWWALLIACYGAIQFLGHKDRIAWVFFVLNIIFAAPPAIALYHALMG